MDILGLNKLAHSLKRTADELSIRARRALVNPAYEIRGKLVANSPIFSGKYRGSWVSRVKQTSGNVLSEVQISNSTFYGQAIELGSEKGQFPWHSAVAPPKGKTVEINGRIYTTTAPEGVIEKTVKSLDLDNLTKDVADQMFSGIF